MRQNADLSGGGAGENERGLTRPELALDGDDLHGHFGHELVVLALGIVGLLLSLLVVLLR